MDLTAQQQIVAKAALFAQEKLEADRSGHDWWHVDRVARTANLIAQEENADAFLCEIALQCVRWKARWYRMPTGLMPLAQWGYPACLLIRGLKADPYMYLASHQERI
jgi:hypothetical protein